MKAAYNYTIVERHKQRIYIPYIGIEFSGWTVVLGMLAGTLLGVFLLGVPLSFILGDFAYIFSLAITALIETAVITFISEIDHEFGKNKLLVFYYTHLKKYRLIYDQTGKRHYISGKREGVIYYVC